MLIDFDKIAEFEGGHRLEAYVPQQNGIAIASSGVTVSSGIDLGQQSIASLEEAGVGENLILKLIPYVGKKKDSAILSLAQAPLILTVEEETELRTKLYTQYLNAIKSHLWRIKFNDLPIEVRTVLFSLGWNLGVRLTKKIPNLIKILKTKNWVDLQVAILNIHHLDKGLRNRRIKEAEMLTQLKDKFIKENKSFVKKVINFFNSIFKKEVEHVNNN